ncbi:MAG TPA: hypothetical protein VNU26_16420 [Mycobacteriales bacterium]|nr:hypothetical protein [Mycobacteriales bacterium]
MIGRSRDDLEGLPEHVQESVRRHRRRTAVVLGALGVAVAALGVLAVLRVGTGGGEASTAPDTGVLAASAEAVWSWSGPADCSAGDPPAALTRRDASGETSVGTPLRALRALAVREASLAVLGRDDACLTTLAVSADGGQTWRTSPAPDVVDVRLLGGGRVLAVRNGATVTEVVEGPPGSLAPAGVTCPERQEPRAVGDHGERPYLLCEDDPGLLRLLQRSTGGGWEYLTDTRPATGLDGAFRTRDLEVLLDGPGLLLADDARCREGALRRTEDGGATWAPLPCPRESLPGAVVLDVALSPDGEPLLLVLQGGAAVVVGSDDGGRSWRALE